MKKNQRWMVLTTTLLICIAMTGTGKASPDTVITVDPQSVEDLEVGKSFTVNITVTDVADLYSWDINMTFNPAILKVENTTEGPFLHQFGETVSLPVRIYNDRGFVIIGGMFMPPIPENLATGSGVLATVTFTVKGYGETSLGLQSNLYAPLGIAGFETPVSIDHTSVDGVFRNATATVLSIELIIGVVVVVTISGIAVFFYRRRRTISEA